MSALTLFNVAQTFWVEANEIGGSSIAWVAGADIFFKHMPSATNNQSGINSPGVTMYLAETIYNVPMITANTYLQWARLEYNSIQTSSDASAPSRFIFNSPVQVQAGKQYALLLSYDGNETFVPWTAEKGWWEVGTRNIYTESNGLVGLYYEFSSQDLISDPTQAQTQAQYQSFWTPLDGYQMTFDVFVSRYYINGIPVSDPSANVPVGTTVFKASFIEKWNANTGVNQYQFPNPNMEGIQFSNFLSIFNAEVGAQRVYQNTVPYGGTANPVIISCNAQSNVITANATMPNGTAFNWNTVFNNYTGVSYIVSNGGGGNIQINRVVSIINTTAIQVSSNARFTNANSTFFISPVAWVDSTLASSPHGKSASFLFLISSNANSTVRFVNNQILSVTSVGGTNYNNTDVLTFNGFENIAGKVTQGYSAVANVVTDGSGNLLSILMANLGCGFTNTANISASFANSSGGSSNGTGGTFTYNIGAWLNTVDTLNSFANCQVMNIDIDDVEPFFTLTNPVGTSYTMDFSTLYYIVNDATTASGFATYALPQDFILNMTNDNVLLSNNAVAFVSRSNEFGICYANGTNAGQTNALATYSNSFILNVDTMSNNDFLAVTVDSQPTVEMGKFIINNDYTGEETNTGNAYAKHLSTQIAFNGLAEDIRVYLTVYKPAFTDFECYVRIQNSTDTQQFTTENWTRLHLVDGSSNNQLSSATDITDYVQLTYGFQPYPNSAFTLAGTANVGTNTFIVTGQGTNFTANLVTGSMIKLYTPLFPSNYMITTVNTVTNATQIIVNDNINGNTSLGGNPNIANSSGLAIDVITFTHQGFNNALNENVVRYFNSSLIKWDGYNNLQLKIVMLSSKLSYIPRLNAIQLIGVSA
jgi:hypothetical protein